MERRSFLKGLALLASTPLIRFADTKEIITPDEFWFSNVREQTAYDVWNGGAFVRLDILAKKSGLPVHWAIDGRLTKLSELPKARQTLALELQRSLALDGISPRDLVPFTDSPS